MKSTLWMLSRFFAKEYVTLMSRGEETGREDKHEMKAMVEEKMAEKEKEARRRRQIHITGIEENENETPPMLKKRLEGLIEQSIKMEREGAMIVDVFGF